MKCIDDGRTLEPGDESQQAHHRSMSVLSTLSSSPTSRSSQFEECVSSSRCKDSQSSASKQFCSSGPGGEWDVAIKFRKGVEECDRIG